jgi:hypothetical protein
MTQKSITSSWRYFKLTQQRVAAIWKEEAIHFRPQRLQTQTSTHRHEDKARDILQPDTESLL